MNTHLPAWRAWFDGSAKPNPGRCSIGALLLGPAGERHEISRIVADGDSSDAEYRALIALLELAIAHDAQGVEICGDSQVIINDVNGPDAKAAKVLLPYRAKVRALLPQVQASLRWIPRHRNGAADALSLAARAIDWQAQCADIAAAAQNADGAHDANHSARVWRNAQALLEEHPEADRLTVMAACYLHDLVNLPKNHPERHLASRQSAELARSLLAARGFAPERLDGVAHAIACHSFSAALRPETIEAQIVQDADRLDALGAIGLARWLYVSGSMGRPLADTRDPLAQERPLDDAAFALDHIPLKLATLPDSMQTAAARALGQQRLQRLLDFRTDFANEWLGR